MKKSKNEQYTVLIAPSWGEFGLLNKYGEKILSKLSKSDYKIVIRPHPQSLTVEKKMIDNLILKFKDISNIKWDFEKNNLNSLSNADILISDFSCIMMDYAFLFKKPFLYFNTNINFETLDCGDLNTCPPWRYQAMNDIGRELKEENNDIENLISIIENLKSNSDITKNIENASNYAWANQGNSACNVVDFLVKTQMELKDK